MIVNTGLGRYTDVDAGFEPIRTRPDRYTEDGEPVRFRRPGRSTTRQRRVARALGMRRY